MFCLSLFRVSSQGAVMLLTQLKPGFHSKHNLINRFPANKHSPTHTVMVHLRSGNSR